MSSQEGLDIWDTIKALKKIQEELAHAARWGIKEVQFCTDPSTIVRGSKYGPIAKPSRVELKREKNPDGEIVAEIFIFGIKGQ